MSEINSLTTILDRLTARLEIVADSKIAPRDKALVREALVMRLALLYDLTAGSSTGDRVPECWKRTILGLTTLDVRLYASDWKILREIATSPELRSNYPEPRACKRVFKRLAAGRIHYKWILSITLMLVEGGSWWWKVNQFVVFDSKLNLATLDLTVDACADYLAFEQSIPRRGGWRNPDGKGKRLLNIAIRSARDLAGDFDIHDYAFRPSHGGGATAELDRSDSDWWHKNRYFMVDGDVITYLKYRVPQDDWREWFYVPYRGLKRCSTLVCVPKSLTSNRTISKEPTTLQYLQQDVFRAMDDYFQSHLHSVIDLHDQNRSRTLAQVGSADGSYATIDLSTASDSVTLDLVETLLDGLPLLYPLLATRSTHVAVKSRHGEINEVIEAKKFAPMGSSCCFPVECLIFAIMAETAVRRTSGRASHFGDYVVYGDDLVIKTQYSASLVETLEFFGFTVNKEKSFCDKTSSNAGQDLCLFREACGIECFRGEDVTPLRLSRRLVSLTDNDSVRKAGEGVGMVDLVNRAYLFRYTTLRRWLMSVLSRYKWFRTCQYLALSDYREFANALASGRTSHVRVAAPFIITDDACDTNYRCFSARYKMRGTPFVPRFKTKGDTGVDLAYQEPEALVSVAEALAPKTPQVLLPPSLPKKEKKKRSRLAPREANDYFTWWCRTVTKNNVEPFFELDAMGIVTLRPSDLKWSKKWVILQRVAHPTQPDKLQH